MRPLFHRISCRKSSTLAADVSGEFKILATNISTIFTCEPCDPIVDFTQVTKRTSELFNTPAKYVHPKELNYVLPKDGIPEFAFVGRSNVGKSTLVGTLLGDKSLVKISKSPGCTQNVNYFAFESKNKGKLTYLVDLPGYGYASAPKINREQWSKTMGAFLRERNFTTMRRVFLLIDSRRGIKPIDQDMMGILNKAALPFQVVLTKTDCVSKNELFKAIQSVFIELNKRNRQAGVPFVHIVSAKSGEGIEDLKREIGGIVYQEFAPMEAVSAEVSAMRKAEEELIMNKGKS